MSLPAIIFQRLRLRYAWALFAISRKACRIGINDFEPEIAEFVHEPWRHRSGLDPYAGIIPRMATHHNADLFWNRGALASP